MIIKIETIASSHGAAAINYAMEKGVKEDRSPRPEFLQANYFSFDPIFGVPPSPIEVYDLMRLEQKQSHHRVKDPFFRIEICPPQEECQNWTKEDWQKCLTDAIKHLDNTDCIRNKKVIGRSTDLKHSQWVATIHRDTDNWHIHLVANRLTMGGKMQDGHRCHERAKMAANAFADERGWTRAENRPDQRKNKINIDAYNVLRGMKTFSYENYFAGLRAKGWLIDDVWDSKGACRGYSVGKEINKPDGQLSSIIKYKSSELGYSRDLMPSKLKATWQKLQARSEEFDKPKVVLITHPTVLMESSKVLSAPPVTYQYEKYTFEISHHIDEIIRNNIFLPAEEDYADEREVPEMPEMEDVAATAAAIFAGYIDAATTIAPSGGGSGGAGTGWRDKEDDENRAVNAARAACIIHTPAHGPKIKRGRRI